MNQQLTDLPDIRFSDSTMLGYGIAGVIYLLIPVIAFLLMKKYGAARIWPVIVGAVLYFLSVTFSNLLAHLLGFPRSFAEKTVIAAELVCFLEETARWLAVRYPLTDILNMRSAVCYGIGHGGLECWIRGMQKFQIMQYGQQLNSEGIRSFLSERQAENIGAAVKQMQAYAGQTFFLSLLGDAGGIVTFGVQIALTLLIFRKMQETGGELRWLALAILLHDGLNAAVLAASLAENALFTALTGIVCGCAVIGIVYRLIDGRSCIDSIRYPLAE